MPDSAKCFPLIRGKALRVTKLDSCGNPVYGPDSVVTTKGFIQVSLSPQTDEGTTIQQTNANGDTCVRDDPTPQFLNFTAEIQLCGVDPDLYTILSGQDRVFDDQATPQAVGIKMNSKKDLSLTNFALELWSGIAGEACGAGTKGYGYFLLPFMQVGSLGDVTIQNDAITFTISNAKSKDGNNWGVGPFNVLRASVGAAPIPLLAALDPNDHFLLERTTLAPPTTTVCGGQALGVPATSAVAGIPGTYLPANSYAPANLAGMTGLTASPTTAWTVGQYVLLRDGSKAKWNGTTWIATT